MGRTATMLDQLVDHDALASAKRTALAGDTVSLSRVLRQGEIAGHDPEQALREAITSRDSAMRAAADVLGQRAAQLERADEIRARWYATPPPPAPPNNAPAANSPPAASTPDRHDYRRPVARRASR